jgi:molybdopterin synthase sulfur carrier subunit
MQVEVTIPSLLRDCTNHQGCFFLEAGTLAEALQRLVQTYPLLRVHLYDEAERLRPHVLIFFNEESIAWLERLDMPLQPGDRIQVLQAVSGG